MPLCCPEEVAAPPGTWAGRGLGHLEEHLPAFDVQQGLFFSPPYCQRTPCANLPQPPSPSQKLPLQIYFFKSTFIFLIGILQTQSLPQGAGMFAFKKAFLFPTNFFKYKFCWHGWMSCHVPPMTCLASPIPGLGVRERRGSNAASSQQ